MTTGAHQQESAQIIPFPARGRFAVAADRGAPKPGMKISAAPAGKVAVSSGWYHEAAIQDADRARTR